jgi:hypothetical protein
MSVVLAVVILLLYGRVGGQRETKSETTKLLLLHQCRRVTQTIGLYRIHPYIHLQLNIFDTQ